MNKAFLDIIGEQKVREIMAEAVRKAVADTYACGFPVTGAVDGVVCRVYPDGRVERIGEAEGFSEK